MAKIKDFNIKQYLALTNNLEEQEPNGNDVNILSKLIGEIRNQMFGQKSEEFYQDKQQYYDAEYALELMDKNNAKTVTFQNVFGKSVTLTENAAKQIKTEVERSVQAIEIKKELINSLWQKFEQDKSHAPKIYSENALNEVLEGLGYEADDLVLPPFNSLPNAQPQVPMHNGLNEQDEFGTMAIYNREIALGGFGGGFNDAHAGNHQFNNFRDDEDADALDNLPNARAQRPMYNDFNEQDAFGTTMDIYNRGIEQRFGGGFNDAHAGNHQFNNFRYDEDADNLGSLPNARDQESIYNSLGRGDRMGSMDLRLMLNPERFDNNQFAPLNEEEENTFNSFANSAIHEPIHNDLGREEPLVPKARTSLAQSKPQEAAITQPRNSDEEVKKINKWLENNNLSKLTNSSTLLLKQYYQDPQEDSLRKICDLQEIWGANRQKLISLIIGESSVREKFLSELDKNGLKVSSSTKSAIMKFLTSEKQLNWSTMDEDAVVQIFIEQELCKYQALKNAGKAREYTMDYKAWQDANEETTNIAARAATEELQVKKAAEQAKIQQLLEEYPNTKPVFNELQELNLGYSQINRVIKKISEFLRNPNSDKTTFNAELSTALVLNYLNDEFNLVNKIFTATISYKERYDHNDNVGHLNENVDHNAGYYYDHDHDHDDTINLLGE